MRLIALSLLASACARPYVLPEAVSDSAVRETRDVRYYGVTAGKNGSRGSALTTWDVQYDYATIEDDRGCRLQRPHVALTIRQSLPSALASDPAVDLPLLYGVDVLLKHEDGHLRIDRAGAHGLADALRSVAPQPNCNALMEAAQKAARRAVAECKASNDAYDAFTRHGTN
ncbi:MAG TPA: DUF922 domain-containing protein [Myxococcales bacterium]|jgi:predicted secreted Zn-dependent protease|nr:DUF922 domain-containing protein [Myxococcales bacterium]